MYYHQIEGVEFIYGNRGQTFLSTLYMQKIDWNEMKKKKKKKKNVLTPVPIFFRRFWRLSRCWKLGWWLAFGFHSAQRRSASLAPDVSRECYKRRNLSRLGKLLVHGRRRTRTCRDTARWHVRWIGVARVSTVSYASRASTFPSIIYVLEVSAGGNNWDADPRQRGDNRKTETHERS